MAGATLTPEGCSLHRAEHLPYRGVANGPAQGVGHRPCAVGRRMGSGAFHWRELVPSRPQLGHLKVLEPCANGRPAMPWGRPSWCEWHCLGFRLGTNPLGREMRGYHSMRPQQGEAKEPGPIPSPPPPCCSTLGPSRWASLATTPGGGDGCMGPLGSQLRGACLCWGGSGFCKQEEPAVVVGGRRGARPGSRAVLLGRAGQPPSWSPRSHIAARVPLGPWLVQSRAQRPLACT